MRRYVHANRLSRAASGRALSTRGGPRAVLLSFALLVGGAGAVCRGDTVMLDFEMATITHDNFGGVASAIDPANLRLAGIASLQGKSLDLVLDSPDATNPCGWSNLCAFDVNAYGVGRFKVGWGASNYYRVRWTVSAARHPDAHRAF
jgi:hypothetical protein